MKNIQEKKTNELKKIIKKSLKKTNTDKLITDIIKRLEDNIEDLSIHPFNFHFGHFKRYHNES